MAAMYGNAVDKRLDPIPQQIVPPYSLLFSAVPSMSVKVVPHYYADNLAFEILC